MATDVDVQYFSHLNGLTLSNNWGDLIRLLDKCLVNGLPITSITSASIDDQGDIHLTLYAAHNCMLFQVIELAGFVDVVVDSISRPVNGKYRIKGVPSANQLILKGNIERVEDALNVGLSTFGTAKLASLGYEIIFRDTGDVKRVYRAKNPTAQHPYIRVDESISDGVNSYDSSYAKSAMVGLLEHMNHIDDYENLDVLQLPFNIDDPTKNWKITGIETNVVRGWSKWYWATYADAAITSMNESSVPETINRTFTLIGSSSVFYLLNSRTSIGYYKLIQGAGLINATSQTLQPPWFLMSTLKDTSASTSQSLGSELATSALTSSNSAAKILATSAVSTSFVSNHTYYNPIQPTFTSGISTIFNGGNIGALEIPIYDDSSVLRGTLPIVAYSGKPYGATVASTPLLSDNSIYVYDALTPSGNGSGGGVYFYLGELE